MGIKAKKERWSLDGLKLEVHKQMSKLGPRKIDALFINIFTPSNLTTDQLNGLKKEIKDCTVLRNIESSTKIKRISNPPLLLCPEKIEAICTSYDYSF